MEGQPRTFSQSGVSRDAVTTPICLTNYQCDLLTQSSR